MTLNSLHQRRNFCLEGAVEWLPSMLNSLLCKEPSSNAVLDVLSIPLTL